MDCPTVRIKATTGSYPFTTINESDFDPSKHELYGEGVSVQLGAVDFPDGGVAPEYHAADTPAPKRGRK